jgi:translation initiation factor eIF-2B subunit gamma
MVSPRMVLSYGRNKYVCSGFAWKYKEWENTDQTPSIDIQLIAPPESAPAIQAALSQNPHLTSLPAPKPDILAPKSLTQTTGTGELFRLPEVQAAVKSDFIVLPCDLVCELDGSSLLETWIISQAGFGGATDGIDESGHHIGISAGGEKLGRRGGLGIWYPTKRGEEDSVKKEETDFVATTPLPRPIVQPPGTSLRPEVSNLVYSIPTDTLHDITDERKTFPVRHALLRKHGRVRMLTTHRNAHIFFFPFWVMEFLKRNETFDNLGEDVLGWWAKAGWQEGLPEKLGLDEVLGYARKGSSDDGDDTMGAGMTSSGILDDAVDVAELSSTWEGDNSHLNHLTGSARTIASRVRDASSPATPTSPVLPSTAPSVTVPPFLAYLQPTPPPEQSQNPLIRRVDTVPLLLSTSLRLAKLSSVDDVEGHKSLASPFAHTSKIAHPESVPKRCRVDTTDSLVAENVTIAEKVNIKESVIGPGCQIGEGARLMKCLLMEGAIVGEGVQLTGCVLGRRCKIEGPESLGKDGKKKAADEDRTNLRDCEVQEGNVVPWGSKLITNFLWCLIASLMFLQRRRRTKSL